MSYSSVSVIRDSASVPVSQYYNGTADAYEVMQGVNGAIRVLLYDTSGNPLLTTANPGYVNINSLPTIPAGTNMIGKVGINKGATAIAGKTAVTTAGTAVTLGSQACSQGIIVTANSANTGKVYVFPVAGTKADVKSLAAGESVEWPVANISALNIDADVSGESVYWHGAN
jgi:hypothetical protein